MSVVMTNSMRSRSERSGTFRLRMNSATEPVSRKMSGISPVAARKLSFVRWHFGQEPQLPPLDLSCQQTDSYSARPGSKAMMEASFPVHARPVPRGKIGKLSVPRTAQSAWLPPQGNMTGSCARL